MVSPCPSLLRTFPHVIEKRELDFHLFTKSPKTRWSPIHAIYLLFLLRRRRRRIAIMILIVIIINKSKQIKQKNSVFEISFHLFLLISSSSFFFIPISNDNDGVKTYPFFVWWWRLKKYVFDQIMTCMQKAKKHKTWGSAFMRHDDEYDDIGGDELWQILIHQSGRCRIFHLLFTYWFSRKNSGKWFSISHLKSFFLIFRKMNWRFEYFTVR